MLQQLNSIQFNSIRFAEIAVAERRARECANVCVSSRVASPLQGVRLLVAHLRGNGLCLSLSLSLCRCLAFTLSSPLRLT